ncbi:hypothetical protein PBY51_021123 [Eleginops maclovinus]|uniref:Uncharacterized protein n=1 Tax=Eleginops maclovinus TaxID=56733 RepID=A0AAN8AGZ8_ELEMC|nr:hypothetical protein PBY51_021123 [Eleginops maclovinus]
MSDVSGDRRGQCPAVPCHRKKLSLVRVSKSSLECSGHQGRDSDSHCNGKEREKDGESLIITLCPHHPPSFITAHATHRN